MQGVLLVDKPVGWTSFDVVNYVRKQVQHAALAERQPTGDVPNETIGNNLDSARAQNTGRTPKVKVGHTGTLDPFASGLLVLLIGKNYTKKAAKLAKVNKTYEVTMRLGEISTTGDPEGEITSTSDTVPTLDDLQKTLETFKGQIEQRPPVFSAIKIDGQRAYKLARSGQEVKLEPRKVTINSLKLVDYHYPEAKLVAEVSSGTYIRSLVEDIGKSLQTGAYTTELRRIRAGNFHLSDKQTSQVRTDMVDKIFEPDK